MIQTLSLNRASRECRIRQNRRRHATLSLFWTFTQHWNSSSSNASPIQDLVLLSSITCVRNSSFLLIVSSANLACSSRHSCCFCACRILRSLSIRRRSSIFLCLSSSSCRSRSYFCFRSIAASRKSSSSNNRRRSSSILSCHSAASFSLFNFS